VTPPELYQLPIQPWMTAPAAVRVLEALGASGGVDVRFVGGAVRNAVMGISVGEIDLATPEVPPRVIARLENAGIKMVPTGLEHGTVMAVVDGGTFEITTLRRDTACDGRHAAVEFTTDWHEDARRRDFTFNALSLRPDGALFDDHGGIEDAKAGRVRFVGAAADRIQEDYLRILRLFRFYAWFGRAPLDETTLDACRIHAPGIARLSAERIQQELSKLLSAPLPAEAVRMMARTGVLQHVITDANVDALARLTLLESHLGAQNEIPAWLRRLALLLPPGAEEATADRLKLSNADREHLKALAGPKPLVNDHTDPLHLRRALFHFGASVVENRVLLAWARLDEVASAAPWRALLAAAQSWTPKSLPIGGEDVLALGVKPGPAVGRLLAAAEEWWIGAAFEPTHAQILEHLRQLVSQSAYKDGI
jgi:poly(A) polymerase